MQDEAIWIPSRHGKVTVGEEARASLELRADAVSACWHALPTDLPWKFLAEFAPLLQPPGVRELSAPPEEIPFLNELADAMVRSCDPLQPGMFARCLAAGMFYFMPHELPLTPPPSRLPLWIRVPYLRWSLALPEGLDSFETGLYAKWREEWLHVLSAEFAEGRGIPGLPGYQHAPMRLLLEQLLGCAAGGTT